MARPIDISRQIRQRMQEIDTYRTHSLFKEARIRCRELAAFIVENDGLPDQRQWLVRLSRKVKEIDAAARAFDAFATTVEMTQREQAVVRRLFVSEKGDAVSAAFETATALLVFGQRAAAMKQFAALLGDERLRVAAAKSIIRCHLGDGSINRAVNQYLLWYTGGPFPPGQLGAVRHFLQAILEKKGFRKDLPQPVSLGDARLDRRPEEMSVDYLSVVLPYADNRFRKKQVMLDVNFQRGKMINCIVSKSESAFIHFLKPGMVFPDVQINATDLISFCSVRLSEVGLIPEGRLKGDTTITMEVMDGEVAPA